MATAPTVPHGSPDAVKCSACGTLMFPSLHQDLARWWWRGGSWWHSCNSYIPDSLRLAAPIQERPIGFTADMINAILEGYKTETRRLPGVNDKYAKLKPGDILYAREAWQIILPVHGPLFEAQGRVHRNAVNWNLCGGQDEKLGSDAVELSDAIPKSRPEYRHRVIYKASHTNGYKFRPGIHQPKWMSRIRLEVIAETTLEPVNVIDEPACRREGVTCPTHGGWQPGQAHAAFVMLWDGIHTKQGERFHDGPLVRVIKFRRVWP